MAYPVRIMWAVAKPLTDAERARIVELCEAGWTCNAIAAEVGRSSNTISRVAREHGHRFGSVQAERAREARSDYGAGRRAEWASKAMGEALDLLEQLHRPHLAFNFGGRDNTYEEHELEEPPVREKRDLVLAAQALMREIREIDKHDNRADDVSAVDEWLAAMTDGA